VKVFVRNNTTKHIKEIKPGIGEFFIPAGSELEIEDFHSTVKTPTKKELDYIMFTAKEIAESIVNDFGSSGLEVIEKEG